MGTNREYRLRGGKMMWTSSKSIVPPHFSGMIVSPLKHHAMSENKFQFPRYLGYAKAIPESHQYDPALQKETLHYAFNNKHLLEVETRPGNVKII